VTQDANVSDPQGAALNVRAAHRLPALIASSLKCVLKQSEIDGNQSDIYGDDRLVPSMICHRSLQDNLTSWSAISAARGRTIWPPRGDRRRGRAGGAARRGTELAAGRLPVHLGHSGREAHQTGSFPAPNWWPRI